jgi:hypothetical protein
MKCYGAPTVSTTLGQITLCGPSQIDDPDVLSGLLEVQAPDQDMPLEDWRVACDELTNKIFDVLSLV